MFRFQKTLSLSWLACLMGTSAWAQDLKCSSWEAFPEGASKAQEYHTIYRDDFKAKKYAEAYKNWTVLFAHVTSPKEAPKRHFEDGIEMCLELGKAATDPAQKAAYAKQMMSLYDHHYKCIPASETASDRAYQGYKMQVLQMDVLEVVKVYERSLAVSKKDAPYFAYSSLVDLAVMMFGKNEKFSKDYMIALYNQCKEACELGMKNTDAKKAENYKKSWDAIQARYAQIEDKIFDCSYYKEKLQPEFNQLGDAITLEKAKEIYSKIQAKCAADDAFVMEAKAKYEKLKKEDEAKNFQVRFDAADAYSKHLMLLERNQDGDQAEAKKWLEKAFETNSFPADMTLEKKGEAAYRIAYDLYRNDSYSSARSWCRRAVEYKPGWGEPYLLVGTMYASSGKLCGPGTGWDSQVVVWAAMDEWSKAKSIDPSVADEANKRIGNYRQYLPSVSDGFDRQIKEGDSYKIGCWIGVTTTARFKK